MKSQKFKDAKSLEKLITKSKNSEPWENVVEFYRTGLDRNLKKLFKAALLTLRDEDKKLQCLFESAVPDDLYNDTSHGLAYWLYETTIVYLIFKAWILYGKTIWDSGYDKSLPPQIDEVINRKNRKYCDLVVNIGKEQFFFEVKWWRNMHKKTLGALQKDVNKLRKNKKNATGYLITLWYSWEQNHWIKNDNSPNKTNTDIEEVAKFSSSNGCKIEYFGAFPTHFCFCQKNSSPIQKPEAYFAMAIFKV